MLCALSLAPKPKEGFYYLGNRRWKKRGRKQRRGGGKNSARLVGFLRPPNVSLRRGSSDSFFGVENDDDDDDSHNNIDAEEEGKRRRVLHRPRRRLRTCTANTWSREGRKAGGQTVVGRSEELHVRTPGRYSTRVEIITREPIPREAKTPTGGLNRSGWERRLGPTRCWKRKGAKVVVVVTQGFKDLLTVGNQARPDISSWTRDGRRV